MKNNLLLKIIAVVIVLIGVGFGIYKSVTKEKDLVFEATIKDVVPSDNKYTILLLSNTFLYFSIISSSDILE